MAIEIVFIGCDVAVKVALRQLVAGRVIGERLRSPVRIDNLNDFIAGVEDMGGCMIVLIGGG